MCAFDSQHKAGFQPEGEPVQSRNE
jgi:hypothetical protein